MPSSCQSDQFCPFLLPRTDTETSDGRAPRPVQHRPTWEGAKGAEIPLDSNDAPDLPLIDASEPCPRMLAPRSWPAAKSEADRSRTSSLRALRRRRSLLRMASTRTFDPGKVAAPAAATPSAAALLMNARLERRRRNGDCSVIVASPGRDSAR